MTLFYLEVETSKKFLFHQISKSYHHMHFMNAKILQELKFHQILIYKQLNQMHFHIQKSKKFLFHQKFQKYVKVLFVIVKILEKF